MNKPPGQERCFALSDPPTEAQVRYLRDCCFGRPCSNSNWDACRDRWLRPDSVKWLLDHSYNPELHTP